MARMPDQQAPNSDSPMPDHPVLELQAGTIISDFLCKG